MSDDDGKIPPKVQKDPLGGPDETHEAYGMVGFSRMSIGGYKGGEFNNFFGSDLANHMACVRLRISTAARRRGNGQYYYHARDRIIEVDLTQSQFADLLTTQNVGDGVPCTIRWRDGRMIPFPPAVETSASKSQAEFEGKVSELVTDAKRLMQQVNDLLSAKSVSKTAVREIAHDLQMVVQGIEKNLPFTLTTFREACADVVTEAKAEVEAFVSNAVAAAGVQAIAGRDILPNLLGPAEEGGEPEDERARR